MAGNAKGSVLLRGYTWFWRRYQGGKEMTPRIILGTKRDLPNKRAAQAERDRQLLKLNPKAGALGKTMITVRELAPTYIKLHVDQKLKPSSADSARSMITKHIVPLLGDDHLMDLDSLRLRWFIVKLTELGLSRGTIVNVRSYLKSMIEFASECEFPTRPWPAKKQWNLPPAAVETQQRVFTPEESGRILAAAEWPWRAVWALFAMEGLRCGEVLGLSWQFIDLERRVLFVRQNAVKRRIQTVKSKKSRRDLPMPDALIDILLAYRAVWVSNEAGLLFMNEHGMPYTNAEVNAQLHAAEKRLDIKHGSSHSFRRGLATTIGRTASVVTVQGTLGHARVETSMGYMHSVSGDSRTAFDENARKIGGG